MTHNNYDCNLGCPVEAALEIISGKWKGAILYHLLIEKMRFNELRRLMPDITQRMLTKQLRELETHQLVTRTIYPEVPPRVEYSITEYGQSLEPVIQHLHSWGTWHLKQLNIPISG